MTPLRQRMMEDLQIRNYAPSTIKAYKRGVADFAKHFGKSPDRLGAEQIREYQLFLIKEKAIALLTYIQIVSGLRFLYTNTLHRQIGIERTRACGHSVRDMTLRSWQTKRLRVQGKQSVNSKYAKACTVMNPQAFSFIRAAQ